MLSINWRRGLIRLWLAASIVWLVGGGVVMQEDMWSDISTIEEVSPAINEAETTYKKMELLLAAARKAHEAESDLERKQEIAEDVQKFVGRAAEILGDVIRVPGILV